jgi:endonuclease-3
MDRPHFDAVMRTLEARYRDPAASSKNDPLDVLLFTMLSSRTRDDQTEIAFRRLKRRFPTVRRLAAAKTADVRRILRSIGLFGAKSRNAIALAKELVRRHGGVVPRTMDELVALPGVGRKTASCVLVYAFGIPAVAVDTHVHRIVGRLGWAREHTAERTEAALRRVLPRRHWLDVNRVMVQFGRDICRPGVPLCWKCPVRRHCAYPKKTTYDPT